MQQIAPDLYLLDGFPKYAINIYLMGDVLVDAGIRSDKKRILRQLQGERVTAHTLTHVHADHQGASKAVCETLDIPLWCGEKDAPAMESGDMSTQIPGNLITRLQDRFWTGPAHPVDRLLREGDEVAGFVVLEVPGHAPGHIAFWRAEDRVLVLGDVLTNSSEAGRVRLAEPRRIYTPDPALNRRSAWKLAQLQPEIICFGHGPPLQDGGQFQEFVAQLPN